MVIYEHRLHTTEKALYTQGTVQINFCVFQIPHHLSVRCWALYRNHYPWYLYRTSWYWTIQFQRLLFHHDHNSQSPVQPFLSSQTWNSQLKGNSYLIGIIDSFTQRLYDTERSMHGSQKYKTQKDKRGTQHGFSRVSSTEPSFQSKYILPNDWEAIREARIMVNRQSHENIHLLHPARKWIDLEAKRLIRSPSSNYTVHSGC